MKTLLLAALLGSLSLAAGCAHRPDVVVRQGTLFTKSSTLSLTAGADSAIFKPELEKELMRRGFNIITDDVSQVIEEERRTNSGNTAAVHGAETGDAKSVAHASTEELTQKQTARISKSDFVGRIDYLYEHQKHSVRRLNFTIFEVKTGSVVASIGYENSGENPEIARSIAEQLDAAMSGAPMTTSHGIFGLN